MALLDFLGSTLGGGKNPALAPGANVTATPVTAPGSPAYNNVPTVKPGLAERLQALLNRRLGLGATPNPPTGDVVTPPAVVDNGTQPAPTPQGTLTNLVQRETEGLLTPNLPQFLTDAGVVAGVSPQEFINSLLRAIMGNNPTQPASQPARSREDLLARTLLANRARPIARPQPLSNFGVNQDPLRVLRSVGLA